MNYIPTESYLAEIAPRGPIGIDPAALECRPFSGPTARELSRDKYIISPSVRGVCFRLRPTREEMLMSHIARIVRRAKEVL